MNEGATIYNNLIKVNQEMKVKFGLEEDFTIDWFFKFCQIHQTLFAKKDQLKKQEAKKLEEQ